MFLFHSYVYGIKSGIEKKNEQDQEGKKLGGGREIEVGYFCKIHGNARIIYVWFDYCPKIVYPVSDIKDQS